MAEFKLKLERAYKKSGYTIGNLYVNGGFFCNTLEDTDRGLNSKMSALEIAGRKIPGQTAIPTGKYDITLNVVSPKFSKRPAYNFCNGKVPRLLNVPGFDGICAHAGSYPKDTEGCLLVGKNTIKGMLTDSMATFKALYAELDKANKRGDKITIEIS